MVAEQGMIEQSCLGVVIEKKECTQVIELVVG